MIIWNKNIILTKEKNWTSVWSCLHRQREVGGNLPFSITLRLYAGLKRGTGRAAFSGPAEVDWDETLAVNLFPTHRVFTIKGDVWLARLWGKGDEIRIRKEGSRIQSNWLFCDQFKFSWKVVKFYCLNYLALKFPGFWLYLCSFPSLSSLTFWCVLTICFISLLTFLDY